MFKQLMIALTIPSLPRARSRWQLSNRSIVRPMHLHQHGQHRLKPHIPHPGRITPLPPPRLAAFRSTYASASSAIRRLALRRRLELLSIAIVQPFVSPTPVHQGNDARLAMLGFPIPPSPPALLPPQLPPLFGCWSPGVCTCCLSLHPQRRKPPPPPRAPEHADPHPRASNVIHRTGDRSLQLIDPAQPEDSRPSSVRFPLVLIQCLSLIVWSVP